MTGLALILQHQFDLLLAAESRLLKFDPHTGPDILSLHRPIVGSSATAAKEISENISENIREIHPGEIKSAGSTGSVEGGMTKLIILPPLLRIAQNRIGLRCLLEFLLGILVAGIHIRMIFFCQLSVSFLDLLLAGISVHAKDLIIISFLLCHSILLSH